MRPSWCYRGDFWDVMLLCATMRWNYQTSIHVFLQAASYSVVMGACSSCLQGHPGHIATLTYRTNMSNTRGLLAAARVGRLHLDESTNSF